MKQTLPEPRPRWCDAAAAVWRAVLADYTLEPADLVRLEALCDALHRQRQAEAVIDAEGLTAKDRYGQTRVHPAVAVERDARLAVLRAVRELGLDLAEIETSARLPRLVGKGA